jgi:uncharacterized protein YjbJ (UPF0337 family)
MSSQQNNEASIVTAIKDQAVGAIKEVIGSVIGNTQMELEGKAQKVHGQNEYDFAKAAHSGEAEPEKFQRAYHSDAPNESEKNDQPVESDPSQLSGLKDQALGAMKSTMGAATGNQDMELKGKAQNIHGRNEAEFAKAQMHGLNEPEHFVQGRKTTDHFEKAEGEVEPQNFNAITAVKDVAVGLVKEAVGTATGNTNTEIAGLAQQMRGKNEAEFVKAQNQGLSEPEHFAHGTKTTTCDQGKGEVEDQKVTSIGAIKEKFMS